MVFEETQGFLKEVSFMKKLVLLIIILGLFLFCSCQTLPQLKESKDLNILNPTLCVMQPTGYREYKKSDTNEFPITYPVWVYFEIDNLKSRVDNIGEYVELNAKNSILDIKGNVVWEGEYSGLIFYLETHTRVLDVKNFWTWYFFKPAHPMIGLKTGEYTIKMEIEETLTKKTGEFVLDFKIVDYRQSYHT